MCVASSLNFDAFYILGCNLRFLPGAVGRILPADGTPMFSAFFSINTHNLCLFFLAHTIVQWEHPYDAFDVFVGEFESFLVQASTGAGTNTTTPQDAGHDLRYCCIILWLKVL